MGQNISDVVKAFVKEYCNVIILDEVMDAISATINTKAKAKRFIRLFVNSIESLSRFSITDLLKKKEFEVLKESQGMFCMHFKCDEFNFRILYYYDKVKNRVLLCGFNEKDKKADSYDKYIPIAKKIKDKYEMGR